MARKREGRGRLSTIDLLPDSCDEDIVWALEQLRERKLPQNAILEEFNLRLADHGVEPISKSAWNRYAVRKAIQFRRLDEAQRVAGELVSSLETDGPDQMTVAVAEMLKVAAFQLLEEDGITPKGIMELSRALQSAVGAQKTSAEARRRLEEELRAKVDKAIDNAGGEGTSPDAEEVLRKIRQDIYGIFEK